MQEPSASGFRPLMIALTLACLSLAGEALVFRNHLDDSTISAFLPTAGDGDAYAIIARTLLDKGFVAALGQAQRTPGYVFFLAGLMLVTDAPFLLARVAQMFAVSLIPMLFFLHFHRRARSIPPALVGALPFLLWPPLHYFVPLLYAESLAMFCLALAMYALFTAPPARLNRTAVLLGLLTAAMTHLRPNMLLILGAFWAAFLFLQAPLKKKISAMLLSLAATILAILPWSIFASVQNHAFIPLTTLSGYTLWSGSADPLWVSDPDTLMQRVLDENHVTLEDMEARYPRLEFDSPSEGNRYYADMTKRFWRENTSLQLQFVWAKILHSLGFSFRGLKDYAVCAFSLAAILLSLPMWFFRRTRPLAAFFWASLAISSLVTALFVTNQRYAVAHLHLPGLLVIGTAAAAVTQRLFRTRTPDTGEKKGEDAGEGPTAESQA